MFIDTDSIHDVTKRRAESGKYRPEVSPFLDFPAGLIAKTPKSTKFRSHRIIASSSRRYSSIAQTGEDILPFVPQTSVVSR